MKQLENFMREIDAEWKAGDGVKLKLRHRADYPSHFLRDNCGRKEESLFCAEGYEVAFVTAEEFTVCGHKTTCLATRNLAYAAQARSSETRKVVTVTNFRYSQ